MTASLPALFDLADRVAIVTGGAGTLGSAISAGLADAGAAVAVVDLRAEAAISTADTITRSGRDAIGLGGDLSSPADVDRIFGSVQARFGRLDILVNAVSGPVERFAPEEFPLDAWQRMIDSNLTSYFLCSQAAAKQMIAGARGGSIVNFSSIAGASALGRGSLAYSAAKGGILQLTREMSYALAPHAIRVNTILPCQFVNAWWAQVMEDASKQALVDRVISGIPLGRLGRPDEIVGPVLFLASDAASMVTGVLLPVDGGNLAMNAGASQTF
jgi:NAD(P)-dependent dehydrogenase (short-subunit alcohol dehydrogenase family)